MEMFNIRILSAAFAVVLALAPARAGEITDAGKAAEQAVTDGDYEAAFESINTARDSIWEQSPLVLRNVNFTAGEPTGYGIYEIRPNNEFKSGEAIVIYTEPRGYGFGEEGDFYVMDMSLDYEVKDVSGKSLAKQENFDSWTLRSRYPNKEFMGKLNYTFSGITPGDYVLSTTVHDKNSEKTASFSIKFKIVP
jgi:hypothetical protein